MPGDAPDARDVMEARIREACERGEHDRATALLVEGYGPEIVGFLEVRLRSDSDASEAFSLWAEDVWHGLPKFEWRSSARTWAYTLARNAATRYLSAPERRPARNLSLSRAGFSEIVEHVRTTTVAHLRTVNKSRIQTLREELPEDDQLLLVLRVDREMAWRDIALVMGGEGAATDDDSVEQRAASLRKRFERAKDALRELAVREGLLPGG